MKIINPKCAVVFVLISLAPFVVHDCKAEGAGDAAISNSSVMLNEAERIVTVGGASGELQIGGLLGLIGGKGGKVQLGSPNTRSNVNTIYSGNGRKITGAQVMLNKAKDVYNIGAQANVNAIVAE